MPLHPQAKMVLDQMKAAGLPELGTLPPVETRKIMDQMRLARGVEVEKIAHVEDRRIPGPSGEIPVRIYRPDVPGTLPVLVYYHGGGWVIGDLESHDGTCRALSNRGRCVTVAVDYRLAPEHKFPAAVDDAYAATLWVAKHASELNVDPRRLAVGGDSAGGNLAAVVSILARDRKEPAITFQLLIYPATDAALDTYSHKTFTDYLLTDKSVRYFYGHYLRSEADKKDPRMSPALTTNLKGLPPALIITAEFDPLRDEGEAYAKKLTEAGNAAKFARYEGMIHGFFGMPQMLDSAKAAIDEAGGALRKALSS
ncbi:MAG TPA: alpha/beta hydrolase [Candidatus Binataceae bacterium]|nr:alpha/beta hydrolase [Candidatus Binataceae bacterium]